MKDAYVTYVGNMCDAIIEVYSLPVRRDGRLSGVINWFVNCPVRQTLNNLAGNNIPVALFKVRYKGKMRTTDSLGRRRYCNRLYASEIYYCNDED